MTLELRGRAELGCLLAAALRCLACVDSEPGQDPLVAGRAWCSALCTLFERCGEGGPAAPCTNGCVSSSRPYMQRIVAESIAAEAACFEDSTDCSGGTEPVFNECFTQAGLAAPPSADAERFCAHMAQTFFECRWFESPDSCSQVHARYTGAALAAGRRCSGTPCEELVQCMEAWVWTYGE